MRVKFNMSRVSGSRRLRIELSERTAALLLQAVLDAEQKESLHHARRDVRDVHAEFVLALKDELDRPGGGDSRGDPNYSAAVQWLQDVAEDGPNTGVLKNGDVLASYARLMLAALPSVKRVRFAGVVRRRW